MAKNKRDDRFLIDLQIYVMYEQLRRAYLQLIEDYKLCYKYWEASDKQLNLHKEKIKEFSERLNKIHEEIKRIKKKEFLPKFEVKENV